MLGLAYKPWFYVIFDQNQKIKYEPQCFHLEIGPASVIDFHQRNHPNEKFMNDLLEINIDKFLFMNDSFYV